MKDESHEINNRIERMLRLLLALKIKELHGDKSQTDLIELLGQLGCTSAEIVSFTGFPKSSVAPALSKSRKKEKRPTAKQKTKNSGKNRG